MTLSSQDEIYLRKIGIDDWQVWRKLRLQALEEAPYAFSSKLADWQGQGDTETRWRGRLSDVPLNIVVERQKAAAGMVSATAPNPEGSVELIDRPAELSRWYRERLGIVSALNPTDSRYYGQLGTWGDCTPVYFGIYPAVPLGNVSRSIMINFRLADLGTAIRELQALLQDFR